MLYVEGSASTLDAWTPFRMNAYIDGYKRYTGSEDSIGWAETSLKFEMLIGVRKNVVNGTILPTLTNNSQNTNPKPNKSMSMVYLGLDMKFSRGTIFQGHNSYC